MSVSDSQRDLISVQVDSSSRDEDLDDIEAEDDDDDVARSAAPLEEGWEEH